MINRVIEALDMAVKALNATPSFDTMLPNPDQPGRRMTSYQLIPRLERVLKEAQGLDPEPFKIRHRPLYEIAREIRRDWVDPKNGKGCVYFGAEPYLVAMASCDRIDGMYGCDDVKGIVLYFLCNAKRWTGPVARRIKEELNVMVKGAK